MSEIRLCVDCRWFRREPGASLAKAKCGAAVPSVSLINGSEIYPRCGDMRSFGECGVRGVLWQRGGFIGWLNRFVMHGEAGP